MASYAAFSDVEARAGRYGSLFSVAGKQPDEETIESILTDLSAELDAAISGRGFDPATMSAAAKAALLDTAAYGALSRTLASVPSGDKGLDELKLYARKLWGAAMGDPSSNTAAGQRGSIASGTHPVIALLGWTEAGPTAGNFWDDNPGFGTNEQIEAEARTLTASLAPGFAKGQTL